MFKRPRSPGDSQDRSATSSTFDDVLSELEAAGKAAEDDAKTESEDYGIFGPDDVDHAADEDEVEGGRPSTARSVSEHTATLRATRDAQQQAQEMLAMAAKARNDATEQAEKIVVEAQEAADRVRAEATAEAEEARRAAVEWVKAQRARVDAAITTLTKDAESEAESIRAEAMRSAMAEAEQTARVYVGEAAARGARDAEEIRSRARELLHRASALGSDLQASMSDVAHALEITATAVRDQLEALDALLDESRRESLAAGVALVATSGQQPMDLEGAVDDDLDETGASDRPSTSDGEDARSERVAERSDSRQLGSIFRTSGNPEA